MKSNSLHLALAALCLGLFVFAGCNGARSKKAQPQSDAVQTRAFPETEVPMMYEGDDRLMFKALHYWDAYLDTSKVFYSDTSIFNGVTKDNLEKAFGTYAVMVEMLPLDKGVEAVSSLFDQADLFFRRDTASRMLERVTFYVQKYFYDPNSPVRSEDLYLPFVTKLSVCPSVPQNRHPGYAFDARMCALNRTGIKAADFEFTDLRGRIRSLYSVKAPLTLLFFSNPGCPSCKGIIEALTADGKIADMVSSGKLAVVNIYIDQEIDKWKEYAGVYPKNWYSGYDHKYIIRTDVLYNVRAIPSMYILDKDKKVIMKDAPEDKALGYLDNLPENN